GLPDNHGSHRWWWYPGFGFGFPSARPAFGGAVWHRDGPGVHPSETLPAGGSRPSPKPPAAAVRWKAPPETAPTGHRCPTAGRSALPLAARPPSVAGTSGCKGGTRYFQTH